MQETKRGKWGIQKRRFSKDHHSTRVHYRSTDIGIVVVLWIDAEDALSGEKRQKDVRN